MKLSPKTRGQWIRFGLLSLAAVTLFTCRFIVPFIGYLGYEPQNGDLVFQPLPRDLLIEAIEGATHSPYSHCGAVVKKDGSWTVIQALGDVHYIPLYSWIAQGRWGKFAVYRLRPGYSRSIPRFLEELDRLTGLSYDIHYRMDDDALYCSELIYKAYRQAAGTGLGRLVTLGELDWQPFEGVIKKLEGGTIPLERVMITPKHLSEAPQLQKIYTFGL